MGMFTKLFSKSHDPYELGGRWYMISTDDLHAENPVFKCDDVFDPESLSVQSLNFFFTIKKPNLKPIAAFIVRDFFVGSTSTTGMTQGYTNIYKYADGRTSLQASQLTSTGRMVVYIYCI